MREAAKLGVEGDRFAPPRLPVEEGTLINLGLEHLFEAQRLGAELNLVGTMGFWHPRLYSTG